MTSRNLVYFTMAALAAPGAWPVSSLADTLNVPGTYSSIQAAINVGGWHC